MTNGLFQVPKPFLGPDYGPSAGGTKIRIRNLSFGNSSNFLSTMKIFLGKKQCHITEYAPRRLIRTKREFIDWNFLESPRRISNVSIKLVRQTTND